MRFFLFSFSLSVFLCSCSNNEELINAPQKNDVYIFEEAGVYSPMKVDSVLETTLYLVNSKFVFEKSIPSASDIIDDEFDRTFFMIYEKEEIKRLFTEGKIVKVYRE